MDRTHQLLQFLSQQTSAPTQLLATLQVELTNINDIYISYKPTIIQAINLWTWVLHLMDIPSITIQLEEAYCLS